MKKLSLSILLLICMNAIIAQETDSVKIISNQLSSLQSALKELESTKDKLTSGIEKSKKEINEDETGIKENDASITTNNSAYDAKNLILVKEKEAINQMNPTAIQEHMKEIDGELKKTQSDKDKANKEIAGKLAQIEKLRAEIDVLNQTLKQCDAVILSKKSEYDKLNLTLPNTNLEERQKNLKPM